MSYLDKLKQATHDELVNMMYYRIFNDHTDYDEYEWLDDKHGCGLRIPCAGMTADVPINFTGKKIMIVKTERFCGITTTKYTMPACIPTRWMTEEEVDKFVDMLEAAYAEIDKGAKDASELKFSELWDWFQTLEM